MVSRQVLITGGTGFIGKYLCRLLLEEGFGVHVVSRQPLDGLAGCMPQGVLLYNSLNDLPRDISFYGAVNLAGEPLAAHRWNEQRKQSFRSSRIDTTKQLYDFFVQAANPPQVLVNGSAIGYYGPYDSRPLNEHSEANDCFSHQLCRDWEAEANVFASLGCRVCCMRIGVVLGKEQGALAQMLPAFRMGLGGRLGTGQQWFSWIHIEDMVRMILWALTHSELRGAVNGTAPGAVTNADLSRQLASALNRPLLLPMPGPVVRLLFGELADELLLSGQRVVPEKVVKTGFAFRYPELSMALADILG